MKRKSQEFKAGTNFETLAHYVRTSIDELTGYTELEASPSRVRVTVEILGAGLEIGAVVEVLGLTPAQEAVEEFVYYRRAELAKPIKSDVGLRRILAQFKGRPDDLRASIEESIRQGWTGLFLPKGGGVKSRAMPKAEGDSVGGKW